MNDCLTIMLRRAFRTGLVLGALLGATVFAIVVVIIEMVKMIA